MQRILIILTLIIFIVRGELAEVGWSMTANHGGGYSYRLCKIPEDGPRGLTEECFQRTPLFFASNQQCVQTGYDRSIVIDVQNE